MRKTFVETRVFTARMLARLTDDAYRALQNELMAHPDKGRVIPGCGGLRKVRVADPRRGKGKRSGARVIYLNIPEAERIDMITIYGKDEADDLTEADKKEFRRLVTEIRREAIARFTKTTRRPR